RTYAREHDLSLVAAAREAPNEVVKGKARRGLAEFCKALDGLVELAGDELVAPVLREIVRSTHYYDYLAKEYPEEEDRTLNVESLIGGGRDWDVACHDVRLRALAARESDDLPELFKRAAPSLDAEEEGWGLGGFLEHAALVAERAEEGDPDDERLALMTVHAAKGLEFDHVFVVGCEETIFPHRNSSLPDEIEEERRLFYVAATRAREGLTVTRARSRDAFGSGLQHNPPSRFLREGGLVTARQSSDYDEDRHAQYDDGEPVYVQDLGAYDPEEEGPAEDYRPGERVLHPTYGDGRVLKAYGSGVNTKVEVHFASGVRTLLVEYARLERYGPSMTDEREAE
ncbi:MAG: ATP-binding domain-containing protein, partial [Planctomycetes bacterium]|nr:ATP-binding domain-containing protein [Planctomycetota bacterium]